MDRLTQRDINGIPFCQNAGYLDMLQRLAAYEDNGTPEEFAAYKATGLTAEEIQEAVDLYPGSDDVAREIKSWVERCTWHVRKCNELRYALDKYEQAESEGRLIVLPCKVGDTIYILRGDGIIALKVTAIRAQNSSFDRWIIRCTEEDGGWNVLYFNGYGRTVFRTRKEAEEAEAALGGGGE